MTTTTSEPMRLVNAPSLYTSPAASSLQLQFVGQHIANVPTPAAVIDAAVVRRNCKLMLETVSQLGVAFRAHVKTHKTTEITKLQVGEGGHAVRLIGSTLSEIENLVPWLLECKAKGREIDVLYGLPVAPSAIPRLAGIAGILGEGAVALFTDHPEQVKALDKLETASWPGTIPVWVNIDVGDHREGVPSDSAQLADVANAISSSTRVRLAGVYTHLGTSYSSSSPEEAMKFMAQELQGLERGAASFLETANAGRLQREGGGKVTLSLGASPTVTSLQNILEGSESAKEYKDMLDKIKKSFSIEVHAGVYPVMDMQQMATRARPQHSVADPGKSLLSYADLGFRVLVEVASLYPDRTDKPEALIAAGTIALGREPCKSYPGWAVVTPWPAESGGHYDPEGSKTGWIVGRTSQEHGLLTWEGEQVSIRRLEYGQKLMLWPNHACITGVNYGWYLVVDSDLEDPNIVRDVWVRWRGW